MKDFSVKDGILTGVLAIGIPASLANLLMSVSQIITNSMMAQYGDMAVAAYGVSAKVLMVVSLIGIGLGQGIQPLLGFCYGARNGKRFYSILKTAAVFGLCICFVVTAVCLVFIRPIVTAFLTDKNALEYGIEFSRILLSTGWLFGLFYVLVNALQAMGQARPSLIVSVSRQGLIYIPAVYLMGTMLGRNGLVWAQPVADVLSLIMVVWLLARTIKKCSLLSVG